MTIDRKLINWLLKTDPKVDSHTIKTWKSELSRIGHEWDQPYQRAVVGGFLSERLAFTFLSGYRAALQEMVPELSADRQPAFCVTEEGGNRPRNIQSKLTPVSDREGESKQWVLTGSKTFITAAEEADSVFVAASAGVSGDGRNAIKLVYLDMNSSGIKVHPMNPIPFIPEVTHGSVVFDNVIVAEDQILKGDGYSDYVKPFRYLEEIHVFSAVLGMLVGVSRRWNWPEEITEKLIAMIVTASVLAPTDPQSIEAHIAFGGFHNQLSQLIQELEDYLAKTPKAFFQAWKRDQQVFLIAHAARKKRLENAREAFN